MRIKGVCFGWETTTPPARNEGECRRSQSRMLEPKDQEQA